MKECKYIPFPISQLRDLISDRHNVLDRIIKVGIYQYAKKFHYDLSNVAKQIIYDIYKDKLTKELKKAINSLDGDVIGCDEDFNGFNGAGEFDPTNEVNELLIEFERSPYLKKLCVEYYQIHMALQSLKLSGTIESILKIAKPVEVVRGETLVMAKVTLLIEYRDKVIESNNDVIEFLAYLAVKSILGKNNYSKTNKNHILARMLGYSSFDKIDLEDLSLVQMEVFTKYSKRFHMDKLLQQLELKWKLMTYSNHMRGFYITMEHKMTIDDLALIAESKKQSQQITAMKAGKQAAKEKALQQLKKNSTLNKNVNV